MVYKVIYIKEYLKNYITYIKDLTNKTSWIVEEYNQKRQKIRVQIYVSIARIKH